MQHPAQNSFRTAARWFLITALIAINASAATQSIDSLTLSKAIGLALRNSPSMHALRSGMDAAQARQGLARSAYLPTASATASYSNIGPAPKLDFPLPVAGRLNSDGKTVTLIPYNLAFQLFPDNNYDIHAGIDYLIYDFGRRAQNVELAKIGEQALGTNTDLAAAGTAYQVAILFEMLLSGSRMIEAKNEEIANLGQHLDYIERKLATGSTTQFDELRSKVQLAGAQTDSANLLNEQNKRILDFCQLVGLAPSARFRLSGAFDSSSSALNTDSLIAAAWKSRHELELLKTAIRGLQMQQSLIGLDNYPALTAHAQAGAKNGYVPYLEKLQFNWLVGAQINAPIFDGQKSRFKANEIKARLDSLQIVLADIKNRISTEVLKAAADVETGYSNLAMARTNVALSAEAHRLAKLQFEAGVINNLDCLDAEAKLTQSKFAQVLAEYRYTLSRYALQQVSGYNFSAMADSTVNR